VAVRSKASGRQTATLEVWRGAGGVIRHQQRRRRPLQSAGEAAGVNHRQRTKTLRLVRRHFNAHICSSANFGSRNFLSRNFFLEPENFFETRQHPIINSSILRYLPRAKTETNAIIYLENWPCDSTKPSSRIGNFTSQLPTMFWILKSRNFA